METEKSLWVWRDAKNSPMASEFVGTKSQVVSFVMGIDYERGGIGLYGEKDRTLSLTSTGCEKLFDIWLSDARSPFWGNVISLEEYIGEVEGRISASSSIDERDAAEQKLKALHKLTNGEMFRLERDGEPDLAFEGFLLASVSSKGRSRDTGRWTQLSLYKTRSGKFVCQEVGLSQWEGERTRNRVVVVELEHDIQEFFGFGWLAKELYAKVEIDAVEVVS